MGEGIMDWEGQERQTSLACLAVCGTSNGQMMMVVVVVVVVVDETATLLMSRTRG
jgi:hypothetical protein